MSKSITEFGDYELIDEIRDRGYSCDEIIVDIEDYSDDELIQELESRGRDYFVEDDVKQMMTKIWYNRRLGQDYQRELDSLIYSMIGKVL